MWARLVKTFDSTSTSKSHFGWETTHCGPMALKFDYIFQGPFAVGTFSFHAPDLCRPQWPADGSHRHPSRHQRCGQALQNHGKGDSRQISPIQNVNSLLSTAPSSFWEDPAKFMSTPLWVRTCLALGEPSLQLLVATCHSQTSPPSMNKWLSTLRHPAQARHDVPIKNCALMGCLRGRVLQDFRCRSCFLLEFNIELVTPVSLWRHCNLLSAQFQTTHFLVRLAVNRARRTLP